MRSSRLLFSLLLAALTDLCDGSDRREKEREEVEARRALPEQLRLKEDTERAKKSREEKQKGNQGTFFLPHLLPLSPGEPSLTRPR